MEQTGSVLLLVLVAMLHNILWSCIQYFRPLFPGTMLGQNSKAFSATSAASGDVDGTIPNTVKSYTYDGTRPKQKTIVSLPPQQQPSTQMKTERHLSQVSLGTPFAHELPPKWVENQEVLHYLNDDVKHPPTIEPNKPSKTDDLVNTFSNTHNMFTCRSRFKYF